MAGAIGVAQGHHPGNHDDAHDGFCGGSDNDFTEDKAKDESGCSYCTHLKKMVLAGCSLDPRAKKGFWQGQFRTILRSSSGGVDNHLGTPPRRSLRRLS
jgi:hypothetical protein